MKKVSISILSLVLCFILLLVGCTREKIDDSQQENDNIATTIEPVEGGSLNLSVTRFNTLNPLYNQNYSVFQLHHLIYESLVTFTENLDIEPLLARSWVVAPDGQSIDIKLREGVKWHDGTPFTSQDVIFTINLIKGNIKEAKGRTIYTTNLQHVTEVKEIDSNTIRVAFSKPYSNILEVLTFPILPAHYFTKTNLENMQSNSFEMIGTGPFKINNYDSTRVIELKRNVQYWRSKPYIETINVLIVPDQEAQLSLFENKDVDIAQPNSLDWAKYLDDSSVNLFEYISNHFEFIGFNFKNFLLRDNNVRRAIAYGIDRHRLVKDIYLDHGTVADLPVNPTSWLYDEGSIQIGNDLNSAIQLLEQSTFGTVNQSNIRINEDGTPLRFKLLLNSDNILREKKAYFIRDELRKIGIELELVIADWDKYQNDARAGNFDLILGGWELSYIPDLTFAFHSSQVGNTNFIYYSNEVMDEILQNTNNARNRIQKLEAYHELQGYLLEELPYITLFFKDSSVLIRNKVHGNIRPTPYNIFYKVEEWFIAE